MASTTAAASSKASQPKAAIAPQGAKAGAARQVARSDSVGLGITRFYANQIPDVRVRLAIQADKGWFTFDKAFQANQELLQIETQQMDGMEAIKLRWIRAGFCIEIHGNENRWHVTLLHNFPAAELHRNPNGRGATLPDAFAAAEADLMEMLGKKKAVA